MGVVADRVIGHRRQTHTSLPSLRARGAMGARPRRCARRRHDRDGSESPARAHERADYSHAVLLSGEAQRRFGPSGAPLRRPKEVDTETRRSGSKKGHSAHFRRGILCSTSVGESRASRPEPHASVYTWSRVLSYATKLVMFAPKGVQPSRQVSSLTSVRTPSFAALQRATPESR